MLLRADASASLGLGHLSRCLSLAEEFRRRGWHTALASRPLPAMLAHDVRTLGHELIELPSELPYLSEPEYLAGRHPRFEAILTDHYEIGRPWHAAAAERGFRTFAIDDLADRPLGVSLVVNQNLGYEVLDYAQLVPAGCQVLVGPQFALLKEEFRANRQLGATLRTSVRRLLVFMSGGDENNITSMAMRATARLDLPVDVVVGAGFPHLGALMEEANSTANVHIHVNTPHMASLMRRADLAVGAPSSASWERCCLGLPSVLVILAANQARVGAALDSQGAGRLLGWHHELTEDAIESAVRDISSTPSVLRRMSRAALGVTDGAGAIRVADALTQSLGESVMED